MSEQEYSESGAAIYRYEDRDAKAFMPSIGDVGNIKAISDHIESQIGKIDVIFHEIVSDTVHIDVHWVKPSEKFPFHSFVTSGMSDKPMTNGEDAEPFAANTRCGCMALFPGHSIGRDFKKLTIDDEKTIS